MKSRILAISALALFSGTAPSLAAAKWDDVPKGIKVFILAGQSNMVGYRIWGRTMEGRRLRTDGNSHPSPSHTLWRPSGFASIPYDCI